MVDGVVKTVIADSQAQDIDQSEETKTESGVASTMIFKANIKLDQQALMVNKSPLPLAAGMQLSAEIVEGKRTVLQCLLSPVQRVVSEAGMEIDAVTKLISYSDKASSNGTSMRQPTTATMGSDEGMNTSIQKIPTDRRPGTRPVYDSWGNIITNGSAPIAVTISSTPWKQRHLQGAGTTIYLPTTVATTCWMSASAMTRRSLVFVMQRTKECSHAPHNVLLALIATAMSFSGCEKYKLDQQMESLCQQDGGNKVYEKVILPDEMFDESGYPFPGWGIGQKTKTRR